MHNKVKRVFRRLIMLDDTPERIALAFALGVFLAFSPLIGLHTFLGVIFAFTFGLNRFALFLGVFINNPWTLVPIYAAGTYLGSLFVGLPTRTSFPSLDWQAFWSSGFWMQLAGQWQILKPLVLGSSILSVIASVFCYLAALHLIRRRRSTPAAR
jgi:uncharacterized protein